MIYGRSQPNTHTGNGLRKPDLIIYNEQKTYIIDMSVVSDQADPTAERNRKVKYFSATDLTRSTAVAVRRARCGSV
jgi:hypothetical protein